MSNGGIPQVHRTIMCSTSLGENQLSNLYFTKGRREAELRRWLEMLKGKSILSLSGSMDVMGEGEWMGGMNGKQASKLTRSRIA